MLPWIEENGKKDSFDELNKCVEILLNLSFENMTTLDFILVINMKKMIEKLLWEFSIPIMKMNTTKHLWFKGGIKEDAV